jgi:hypothetical protein
MIETLVEPGERLARRLARFRAANPGPGTADDPLPYRPSPSRDLARRLADAVDGEVVDAGGGVFVRVERAGIDLPLDRGRLASLPGQPPADRPLVCLDTETTGLATAAGTVAFLIGLGWWTGATFRQVQLLLPDHAEEGVLLDEVGRHIPRDAWLVTYNGRGFDWPLLVTRFRLARRAAPDHAGHLDLLPIVRRLFRHRMDDARLGTVERSLLGVERHDDVDGWEIRPSRSPLSFATTTPTSGRSPSSSRTSIARSATRRPARPRRAATWRAWPGPSAANGGSMRRSTASTRRWRPILRRRSRRSRQGRARPRRVT